MKVAVGVNQELAHLAKFMNKLLMSLWVPSTLWTYSRAMNKTVLE